MPESCSSVPASSISDVGSPWALNRSRPECVVFKSRSSTISKLPSLPSMKSSDWLIIWRDWAWASATICWAISAALAHDLGLVDHPGGLGADLVHQLLGLLHLGRHQLLAVAQRPTGLADLIGQRAQRLLQEPEHVVARDQRRVRQRHLLGVGDQFDQVAQVRLDVAARVAAGRLELFGSS